MSNVQVATARQRIPVTFQARNDVYQLTKL